MQLSGLERRNGARSGGETGVGLRVFQGSSALTLDAKGRISIPTRYRDALSEQAGGSLTLTRHPDGCLLVYPRPEWEKKREQIAAFPMTARALAMISGGVYHSTVSELC